MSYTDDLKETNRLIREVVLPELVNIRGELDELRRHTWPYVQAQKKVLNSVTFERSGFFATLG